MASQFVVGLDEASPTYMASIGANPQLSIYAMVARNAAGLAGLLGKPASVKQT